MLHGGEGDQPIALLALGLRVQLLHLAPDYLPQPRLVDVDQQQVLRVDALLLQQLRLLYVLREALDYVVLLGLRQRLDLPHYARDRRLLHQQAGAEPRLVLLPEAALDLGDLVPAVEQLELLVHVGQRLLDDRVDRKAGRADHEQRESLIGRALLSGASSFWMRKSRMCLGFSRTTCWTSCPSRA